MYLEGLSALVHGYTNNPFLNRNVRYSIVSYAGDSVVLSVEPYGLRAGDTVKVSNSKVNDGLFVVGSVGDRTVTLQSANFYATPVDRDTLTKVEYPDDVVAGVRKLIEYDAKMRTKLGVKSESVSRVSVTYYDVTSAESEEGYPKMLLAFLDKYKKLRW